MHKPMNQSSEKADNINILIMNYRNHNIEPQPSWVENEEGWETNTNPNAPTPPPTPPPPPPPKKKKTKQKKTKNIKTATCYGQQKKKLLVVSV